MSECDRCGGAYGIDFGEFFVCLDMTRDRENRQREYDEAQKQQQDWFRKRFGY